MGVAEIGLGYLSMAQSNPRPPRRFLPVEQKRIAVMKSSYRKDEHKAVCDAAAEQNETPAVFQRIAAIAYARQVLQRRGQPRSPYGG